MGKPLVFGGNANFQYTATAAQTADLTSNALWTLNEVDFPVNNAATLSAAPTAPSSNLTPTIAGATVTLNSHQDIGNLTPPTEILLSTYQSGTFTAAQSAALAFANQPGDVVLEGKNIQGNTVTFLLGQQPAGVTLTGYLISVPTPLLVSVSTALNATAANGVAFLQSTAPNLPIGQVYGNSQVQLLAPGLPMCQLHS
jgi:hypothetical protein